MIAVAVVAGRLHSDVTWSGLGSYLGYFGLLWWLWASHTFYADRYDTDDLVYRLLAAAQMASIVIIAASVGKGPSASTAVFAAAYAVNRAILVVMYMRVLKHVSETRDLVRGYVIGFGIGLVFWTASIFVDGSGRFVLWAVALAIDLITPWVMRKEQAKVPLDVSHFPERFGLFTILVLGESIAAVAVGLQNHEWALDSTITAVLGVGVATSLWWMYFEDAGGRVVRRSRAVRRTWRPTVWIYTHFLLAAALAAVGVSLDLAVEEVGHGGFEAEFRWLLVGSVMAALLAMAAIQLAASTGDRLRNAVVTRSFAIPFVAVIGFLSGLEPGWVVAGVLGVCVAVLVADLTASETDSQLAEIES